MATSGDWYDIFVDGARAAGSWLEHNPGTAGAVGGAVVGGVAGGLPGAIAGADRRLAG